MNELNAEFESRGLTIIGVTSETEKQTVSWIEKNGAEYAYGYDKGGKLKSALGVRGIPNAVLVNPSGKIVWQGHPTSLTASTVESALDGAITTPVYEWGGSAKGIKKSFLKGDFAKAISQADKLAEKEPIGGEIAKMLRAMVANRVAGYEAALERGDVRKANEGAESLVKGVKGLPEEEQLEALIKKISKDKELKEVLKTQDKLADILATEVKKKKECENCIRRLEKLLKDNSQSFTGGLIEAALDDYHKLLKSLRR